MGAIFTNIAEIFAKSGWAQIFFTEGGWKYAVMLAVACVLLYLAIVKEFEPLILLPMAFGMILANLPGSGVIHMQYFVGDGLEHPMWVEILNNGGLADMLYMGVKLGIYPPLIFLGIGTMTDFAPLISNPKSLLLGAGITIAIQSSSAMTVMLVGLVNSGVMELRQTIGIIMGSNIGTTLTAWILSLTGIESENVFVNLLKPENFSPLIALAGILLIMGRRPSFPDSWT